MSNLKSVRSSKKLHYCVITKYIFVNLKSRYSFKIVKRNSSAVTKLPCSKYQPGKQNITKPNTGCFEFSSSAKSWKNLKQKRAAVETWCREKNFNSMRNWIYCHIIFCNFCSASSKALVRATYNQVPLQWVKYLFIEFKSYLTNNVTCINFYNSWNKNFKKNKGLSEPYLWSVLGQ